jgi:hypothetical protein
VTGPDGRIWLSYGEFGALEAFSEGLRNALRTADHGAGVLLDWDSVSSLLHDRAMQHVVRKVVAASPSLLEGAVQ